MAEDQRLSPAGGHDLNPLRLFPACVFFQVFKGPNVMDLYFGRHAGCPALFTYLSQEPFFEFRAFSPLDGYTVFNDRVGVPSQGDASPGRYQGFLTFSPDDDL